MTVFITALLLYVPPLTTFFNFEHLNGFQLAIAVCVGFVVVIWYEVVKIWKRKTIKS